jgi:hypothetical protein
MRFALIVLLISPISSFAQIPHDSLWAPLRYFIGSWSGTGEGQSGTAVCERNYQWALNGNFIQIRTKSAYAPQEKAPQGEIHEEIGYLNFNNVERKFMMREFHVEGYVNEYRLESISTDGKKYVFASFEIENIPSGWRAREIYEILNDDEYIEIVELAPPGKDFAVYTKATMKRRKPRYTG